MNTASAMQAKGGIIINTVPPGPTAASPQHVAATATLHAVGILWGCCGRPWRKVK